MSRRDRRVTLALKWHYLDNLSAEEVRDRFEAEGIADLTVSTVRDYLTEQPREEVVEQIEQKHADTRLQIAEREEAKAKRAREAERNATRKEPIQAMVPQMDTVTDREAPIRVADWERVPPGVDRRPEWAEERDVVVVFTDETEVLEAGQEYPVGARRAGAPARPGTFPSFTRETVGIERDAVDEQAAALARKEQSDHLEAKGEALGIYSTDINLQAEVESEQTISLDEETAAAIREADLQQGRGDDDG